MSESPPNGRDGGGLVGRLAARVAVRVRRASLRPASRAVATGFVLAFLLGWPLFSWASTPPMVRQKLVVDASFSVDACCQVRLSVNGGSASSASPLRAGARARYELAFRDRLVRDLAIEPGAAVGSSFTLHRVAVIGPGVRDSVALEELREAARDGLSDIQPVPEGARLLVETPQPRLAMAKALVASPKASSRLWWALNREPLAVAVAALLLGCAVVGVGGARRDSRTVLLLASFVLAYSVLVRLPGWLERFEIRDTAGTALGVSAFQGQWKAEERLLHFAVLIAAVAIPAGLVLAMAAVRRTRAGSPLRHGGRVLSGGPARPEAGTDRVPTWHLLLPLGILVFYLVPNLVTLLSFNRGYRFPGGWDTGNLIFWDYLAANGSVPIKDFWYPYGLQFHLSSGLPWGVLADFTSDALVWTYALLGGWLVIRRFSGAASSGSRYAVLAGGLLLGVVAQGQPPLDPARYVGGLGIVLLYASIQNGTLSFWRRIVLGIAVLHVGLLEPAQLVYAGPALALFALADVVDGFGAGGWPGLRRRAVRDAATFGIPIIVGVAWLAVAGQLGGTTHFYRDLGALTAYAARPSPIRDWLSRPGGVAGAVYWAFPVAAVLGTCELLSARRGERSRGALIVAVSVLGFMLLGKQVTRHGMEHSAWVPLCAGPLLWMATTERFRQVGHRAVSGALLGTIAAFSLVNGRLGDTAERVVKGAGYIPGNAYALAAHGSDYSEVDRSRFAPWRFERYGWVYQPVAETVEAQRAGRDGPVWVFADDPLLNVFLGQAAPYYYSNNYDISPLRSQRDLIRRLEQRPPVLAVWNREQSPIDGVPYQVRIPIVYTWAVRNFVPAATSGVFEVLRPRAPAEPVALRWWRDRLGGELNVGKVMAISEMPERRCQQPTQCGEYLRVRFPEGGPVPDVSEVAVTVDSAPFVIRFSTEPGQYEYVINLRRVWFWASPGQTAPRSVAAVTSEGVGEVDVVHRPEQPDRLY